MGRASSPGDWSQWYVRVDDSVVGPVSTELVVRGIEHRKIPFEAIVCAAGGTSWMSLASVEAFRAAVLRSYPPPPPDSEEARIWLAKGFCFPKPAPLPRAEDLGLVGGAAPAKPHATAAHADDSVDVAVDWSDTKSASSIDWSREFHAYFVGCEGVVLPDEPALLESLAAAPRGLFQTDGALWNLALCLAFGSDRVAEAAGRAFFDAVLEQGTTDRLGWMNRALLSSGFLPSGIPAAAGQRAVTRLRAMCPPALGGASRQVAA